MKTHELVNYIAPTVIKRYPEFDDIIPEFPNPEKLDSETESEKYDEAYADWLSGPEMSQYIKNLDSLFIETFIAKLKKVLLENMLKGVQTGQ